MRRSSHHLAAPPREATTQWMVDDVAGRCREVLDALAHTSSPVQLGNSAMLLRGAANDLVSLVELIEGPNSADGADADSPQSFRLSFGDVLRADR